MSGEIVLRLGGYDEIDVYEFDKWLHETYFKMTGFQHKNLYKDRFDVDVVVTIDDELKQIRVTADLVDVKDIRSEMNENMKREIHELSRGLEERIIDGEL